LKGEQGKILVEGVLISSNGNTVFGRGKVIADHNLMDAGPGALVEYYLIRQKGFKNGLNNQ